MVIESRPDFLALYAEKKFLQNNFFLSTPSELACYNNFYPILFYLSPKIFFLNTLILINGKLKLFTYNTT